VGSLEHYFFVLLAITRLSQKTATVGNG